MPLENHPYPPLSYYDEQQLKQPHYIHWQSLPQQNQEFAPTTLSDQYRQLISKVLDERENYISGNLTKASEKLLTADELYQQYDKQLKTARANAQSVIAQSEKEAKETVALEVTKARTDAAKLIEQTNRELEAQKSLALQKLETQVDELSQLIKEKLLGKEVVL